MRLGWFVGLMLSGAVIAGANTIGCTAGPSTEGTFDLAHGPNPDLSIPGGGFDLSSLDLTGFDVDMAGACAGKDLMNDSANCGRCGRSCGTGVCTMGRCPLVTIESNQPHPVGVAVDSTSVYWINYGDGTNGSVNYDLLAGGSPKTIPAGTGDPGLSTAIPGAGGIAVSGTKLVWAVGGTGASDGRIGLSLNKAAAVEVCNSENYPLSIATDGTKVYWTAYGTSNNGYNDGALRVAMAATGSTASNVGNATGLKHPGIVNLQGTTLYFTESGSTGFPSSDGRVNKIGVAGGSLTNLAMTQASPFGVAADITNVYWANASGLSISKAPVGGGTAVSVATSQKNPAHVLVDTTGLYWTDEGDPDTTNGGYLAGTGSVMYLPLTGGTPIALAINQNDPIRIVSDAKNIYWVNQGTANMTNGQVMSTPK